MFHNKSLPFQEREVIMPPEQLIGVGSETNVGSVKFILKVKVLSLIVACPK